MDRPADFTRQTLSDWIAVREGSIEGFPHMLVGYMCVSSSVERTLFTLDWIESPEQRRCATRELNEGETENALKRAIFFHRVDRVRDHGL